MSIQSLSTILEQVEPVWERFPALGSVPGQMTGYTIRPERQGDDLRHALQIERVPTPRPGPGEVLVLVMAAGVNYNGIWAALGRPVSVFNIHGHPFHIPGSDASGVVWETGPAVARWQPGDEVLIHGNMTCGQCGPCNGFDPMACERHRVCGYETPYGSFAQFMTVQAQQLLRKPPHLAWEEAASYGVGCFTAYRMLDRARVGPGETVLIWGGAGGLGCFAIQITRLRGGIPIAIVSNAEKAELARALGADLVLNRHDFPGLAYRPEETAAERARRLAATRDLRNAVAAGLGQREESAQGVDVVFEHIGQETFPASVYLARRMGRIVICGATTGYDLTFDVRHLWMKQKTIIGSHGSNAEESQRANELVIQGKLKPVLTRVYPFAECSLAHEQMHSNEKKGNIACLVSAPRPGLKNLAETLRAV
jgi:crotonyl-CoA carboxylase/reductase